MADETPATPVTVATPAPVDPNAAALALFKQAVAPDPKVPAPSAGDSSTPPAVAPGAPATPAAADPPLTTDTLKAQQQTLSRGFGKLATEKAALHEREQRLKGLERWAGAEDKVKADPAAVLELHGITLEQVAEAFLKRQGIQAAAPTAEERIAALETERQREREQAAKTQETQTAEARMAAVQTGVDTVKAHLEASADKFPVVLAKGEANHVFDAVGRYAVKHSIPFESVTMEMVTTVAEAYEQARQAQVDEELSTLVTKVPALAARFAPPKPATATAPSGEQRQGAQASSVTLVGSNSEAPPPQPSGRIPVDELMRRSLEQFKRGGASA